MQAGTTYWGCIAMMMESRPSGCIHSRGKSMQVITSLLAALIVFPANAIAQQWTAEQAIAAGVLPLPEVLRAGAGVRRMTAEGPVVLRQGSNGMMCTVNEAAVNEFDVRCYRTAFLKVMDYARALMRNGIV